MAVAVDADAAIGKLRGLLLLLLLRLRLRLRLRLASEEGGQDDGSRASGWAGLARLISSVPTNIE